MGTPLDDFVAWFTQHGGLIHRSATASTSANGHCLVVAADTEDALAAGSTATACPKPLTISFTNCLESSLLKEFAQSHADTALRQTVCLRLLLIEQYGLREQSRWWPYLQILPQPDDASSLNTAMWYSESELSLLAGTNLAKAVEARRTTWQHELADATTNLRQAGHNLDPALWTWHNYLWAATVLTSRGFPASSLTDNIPGTSILIPGLDLLNHSPAAKVTWNFSKTDFSIVEDESVDKGHEIFNNYGQKSNEELLIGYGFCIEDNAADSFGVGFTAEVSTRIRETERSRNQGSSLETPGGQQSVITEANQAISEQHDVRLRPEARYFFSPGFLPHLSIVLENDRERKAQGSKWCRGQQDFRGSDICRNKLHTLCSALLLLEKPFLEVSRHITGTVDAPTARERAAIICRDGQLRILSTTLRELAGDLQEKLSSAPLSGIVRLETILKNSPKALLRDFRSALHLALGTRDPQKIRDRDGEECAFTFWICGLWTCHATGNRKTWEQDPFARTLHTWLDFLSNAYGPPSQLSAEELSGMEVDGGDLTIAKSYFQVLQMLKQKFRDSIYSSPDISAEFLLWCLRIYREEMVQCPVYRDGAITGEGMEIVMVIDVGDEDEDAP